MLRSLLRFFALTSVALATPAEAAPAQLFVSPAGNDQWSGAHAEPNEAKSDGPFATITRARDEVRRLKRAGLTDGASVQLRGGVYELAEALKLTAEDSGTEAHPVVYEPYKNEKPVLSGGRRLRNWRVEEGRWQMELPEVKTGDWDFIQLFAGDERRPRPRLPKTGWFTIDAELPRASDTPGRGYDRFGFRAGDIDPRWSNRVGLEVLAIHIWAMSRMRIKDIDEAQRTVIFTGSSSASHHWAKFVKGNRYRIENVREALDEPGEWYLERPIGLLTYLPKPGENPASTEMTAPRTSQLLLLEGDAEKDEWVQHVTFRGITFAHTNWVTPPEGNSFPQAEANITAAIAATGTRHCVFESCDVKLTGGYGMELGASCQFNRIDDCEFVNLGAGGIKIGGKVSGGVPLPRQESELASDNVVRNCLFQGGGRLHPAAIGIWIGHSPRNTVEQNEISDFYYTGISLGWSWGYQPSHAHHNTIAFNRISKIGQAVLSDMGGIYTLGNGPGNVLHHNVISEVDSAGYGGWGIYFDEGSTAFLAENNIAYRLKSAGFHQHYGRENIVRNNIFAFGRDSQLMRTRNEPHLSFTLERNIIYAEGAPFFASDWNGTNFKLERNLYWDASGKAPVFPGNRALEAWQKETGHDAGSVVADPLFADAAAGNFTLKEGSPALKLGFQPIDVSTVGRRTPRRNPAKKIAPGYTAN